MYQMYPFYLLTNFKQLTITFSVTINGAQRVFNVANPDFNDNKNFYERHPDPTNLFNMIYRNDGKGLNSIDTGFFVMFKQGVLEFEDFNFTKSSNYANVSKWSWPLYKSKTMDGFK